MDYAGCAGRMKMDSKFLKAEEFGVRLEIVQGLPILEPIRSINIRRKLTAFAPPSKPPKSLPNRTMPAGAFTRRMSMSVFPISL